MTDADRAAYENLLTAAVDALVLRVSALLPTDDARADAVTPFRSALSGLIEQTLSRASSQAAGATLHMNSANEARLARIEARLDALDGGTTESTNGPR